MGEADGTPSLQIAMGRSKDADEPMRRLAEESVLADAQVPDGLRESCSYGSFRRVRRIEGR